ncbi:O-antigen ligase family protein [Arundinibacter roseus]|uniref:O-antigen ligase domain-containing protein n=1 Tax=Arundinibacter roseus TaxID=2070510 RepID=A0A4V2X864_9BACT|nr:O-antigen ligase family protein [Arundinibacter roseus]TDB58645.1 O-antigen ligase domain-containing protein [Arundinibacter roseus]
MITIPKSNAVLGFLFGMPTIVLGIYPDISGISLLPVLIFFILVLSKRKSIILPVKLVVFIFLFIFFVTLSYFYSNKTDYSTYKLFMIYIKVIPLIFIPILLGKDLPNFINGYVLAGFISVLFLFSTLLLGANSNALNNRIYIGKLNPIWISRNLCELILLVGLILNNRKGAIIILLIGTPIIYLSGSKGPVLSMILVFFYSIFNQIFSLPKEKKIFSLIIAILFFGSIMFFSFELINRLDTNSYLVQRFFRAVPDYARGETYETSRVVVWPRTIFLIIENFPKILFTGFGMGDFSFFYSGIIINDRIYPHNLILELIVEYGILFTLFIFASIFNIWHNNNSSFKFLLLYFFLNSMVSGDLILNEFIFFYLSCMTVSSICSISNKAFNK